MLPGKPSIAPSWSGPLEGGSIAMSSAAFESNLKGAFAGTPAHPCCEPRYEPCSLPSRGTTFLCSKWNPIELPLSFLRGPHCCGIADLQFARVRPGKPHEIRWFSGTTVDVGSVYHNRGIERSTTEDCG